ncbi:cytochrome P450 [Hyaloraphidium curvatum]|nr:cytochrome P450 [Hyaloraphidium curvatum]
MSSLFGALGALVPSHMGLVQAIFTYSLIFSLTAALIGTLFVLYLYFAYPDRAMFTRSDKERPDAPLVKEGVVPVLGHLPLFTDTQNYFIESQLELTRKYGDVFRMGIGFPIPPFLTFNGKVVNESITITNVKDVEHVLRDPYTYVKGHDNYILGKPLLGDGIFAVDGHAWSVQRKTASSIFNGRNFRDYYGPVFQADALKVRRHLRAAHDMGARIDLQDLLLRSTMESFVRIAFGVELGNLDGAAKKDEKTGTYVLPRIEFAEAFDSLNRVVTSRSFSPIWNIEEKFNGREKEVRKWQNTIESFAYDVIAQKRRRLVKAGEAGSSADGEKDYKMRDLLDLFMATKNEDGSELTDAQLKDVAINFLLAGRDTTAQTLCWVFYNLHSHPEVEKKTRDELMGKLARSEQKDPASPPVVLPGYDDMSKLKYTTAVFNEVLRLHPNVPANVKEASRDDVLPGTGTKVYKGDALMFFPWIMGRLEKIWGPDAEVFKPERWFSAQGDLVKESNFKWPAFNAGPRICLGMNMATQEAQVILAAILSSFHLELVDENSPEKWAVWNEDPAKRLGRYDQQLTLALRGGIHFRVHLVEDKETE